MVAAAVATKVGVFDLVGFFVVSKKDGHIFNIQLDIFFLLVIRACSKLPSFGLVSEQPAIGRVSACIC